MFAKEALSFLHQIKQLDTSHDGSCFDDWGDDSGGGKWVQQWGSAPAAGTLKVATCNKLLGWYPAFAGRYTAAWGKEYGVCKEREVHKPGDCAPHEPNHKWRTAPRSPTVPPRSLRSPLRTPDGSPLPVARTEAPRACRAWCVADYTQRMWPICRPAAMRAHDTAMGSGGVGQEATPPFVMRTLYGQGRAKVASALTRAPSLAHARAHARA